MIGASVVHARTGAAPPRASCPLVRITPSTPDHPERRRCGNRILADHRVDHQEKFVGLDRVLGMAAACPISSSSMASRPAVSMMTRSCSDCSAYLMNPLGHHHGIADAVSRLRGITRDSVASATICNWFTASSLEVGRDKDGLVSLCSQCLASLPASVSLARALQTGA